jgi:hypothetical protein
VEARQRARRDGNEDMWLPANIDGVEWSPGSSHSRQPGNVELGPHLTESRTTCPACGATGSAGAFYSVRGAPVHSVLLLESREAAVNYPTGDIVLAFCPACGFVFNSAFDTALHEYSARYEATQAFSETFNTFNRRLARDLIDRFNLRGKQVLEIGCGQGEFLDLFSAIWAITWASVSTRPTPGATSVKRRVGPNALRRGLLFGEVPRSSG